AITFFNVSAFPTSPGCKLNLAAGVLNPDGSSATVTFYIESNQHAGLQAVDGDRGVTMDADGSDGYTTSIFAAGLPVGSYRYYAYVDDPQTGQSAVGIDAPTRDEYVARGGGAGRE